VCCECDVLSLSEGAIKLDYNEKISSWLWNCHGSHTLTSSILNAACRIVGVE
jgi:hypothetical protein